MRLRSRLARPTPEAPTRALGLNLDARHVTRALHFGHDPLRLDRNNVLALELAGTRPIVVSCCDTRFVLCGLASRFRAARNGTLRFPYREEVAVRDRWRVVLPASALVILLVSPVQAGAQRAIPPLLLSPTGETVWMESAVAKQVLQAPLTELRGRVPELEWFYRERLKWARADMSPAASELSCVDYERYGVTVTLPMGATIDQGLHGTVASAHTVVSGVVVDRRTGFVHGAPAVLLLVEVDAWRSTQVRDTPVDYAYVVFGAGRMRVAGVDVCRRSLGLPSPPRIGDRLLSAARGVIERVDDGVLVLDPGPATVFKRGGKLFTSERLAAITRGWSSLRASGDLQRLVSTAFPR